MASQVIDIKGVETKALSWPQQATALVVADQGGYDKATEALLTIKSLAKEISDHHRPVIQAAFAAHREAVKAEKRLLEPLETAERMIKVKLGTFLEEQEKLRLAEEKRLEEEARKRAEEEAIAAAVQAETELKESGATPEQINEATLEILDQAPANVPAVVAPRTFQAAKGVSASERWSAQVVSLKELARAVADGKQPEALLLPNMPALNGLARSLKGAMSVPGVRPQRDTSVSARAR